MLLVAQLKFVSLLEINFFQRKRLDYSNFIFVEENIERVKFYKVKRLINRREIARKEIKYLVR